MHLKFHFFHFGCCNLPFLHFSFWFLPVKTLKKYSEYSEHLFEYSNIIRLFKMGRIRIRIVLFGKKYSNIRIIRIFVSTLISTLLFQILIDRGMTEEERLKFYRGFILWQQEGHDIEKYPCLFINFGVNLGSSLEGYFPMRRVIMIFRVFSLNLRDF